MARWHPQKGLPCAALRREGRGWDYQAPDCSRSVRADKPQVQATKEFQFSSLGLCLVGGRLSWQRQFGFYWLGGGKLSAEWEVSE